MARAKDKRNMLDLLADWRRVEADTVEFAKREIPNAKGMLTRIFSFPVTVRRRRGE